LWFAADLAGLVCFQFLFLHFVFRQFAACGEVFEWGVVILVVEEGLEGGQLFLFVASCVWEGLLISTSVLELLPERVSEPLLRGSFSSNILSNYCIYNICELYY
jgi:hypothetical protein